MVKPVIKLLALLLALQMGGWLQPAFAQTTKEQPSFHGKILLQNEPAVGAVIQGLGSSAVTTAGADGQFWLPYADSIKAVVVTYTGALRDTISITSPQHIHVELRPSSTKVVELNENRARTYTEAISATNTEVITTKELFRAACCNLSESFETSPSVDVNFSDALTGAKEIKMLGLRGIYTQTTHQLLPNPRGVGSAYGLSWTPGTWLSGLQLTKGTGPVSTGFESMAGHLNVGLKMPGEDFYNFNGYANSMGRYELNSEIGHEIKEGLATSLLMHGSLDNYAMDMNHDGFADMPTGRQLNVMNLWQFHLGKEWEGQSGVQLMQDNRRGGQVVQGFDYEAHNEHAQHGVTTPLFIFDNQVQRVNAFTKVGWVNSDKPYQSWGNQVQATGHWQQADYGPRAYQVQERSFFINSIYQSIISDTRHGIRLGASMQGTQVNETTSLQQLGPDTTFNRTEMTPGLWTEYTWSPNERTTLVAGLRGDYHNLFGFFATPRVHFRQALSEKTVLRLSAGTGRRTANIFAENSVALASARRLVIRSAGGPAGTYGLQQEVATNVGGSLQHEFEFNYRKGTVRGDVYHTRFQNQVVADDNFSARELVFYNLENRSYSTASQVELEYSIARWFDLRVAYRYQQVRLEYLTGWQQRILTPQHKGFATAAFTLDAKKRWGLDYTLVYTGTQLMPTTAQNSAENQFRARSPHFYRMDVQLNHTVGKLNAYIGVENLTGFRQHDLIISPQNPFSGEFDPGFVWGSVLGRVVYVGVRYTVG